MGIVVVAALAANAEWMPPVAAIAATPRRTNSVRQGRQSIKLIHGPTVFDREVFALGIASLFEALTECAQQVRVRVERCAVEEPDHRHRWLLRARRERPRGRSAEKRGQEFSSLDVACHATLRLGVIHAMEG
jgi:hypothetical protein